MIEILQVGPYPEWDEGPLNEAYKMHRYFEAEDGAAQADLHTSGRIDSTGRLFQLIRMPMSCVTGWSLVADMWQEAQVGATE